VRLGRFRAAPDRAALNIARPGPDNLVVRMAGPGVVGGWSCCRCAFGVLPAMLTVCRSEVRRDCLCGSLSPFS